MIFRTNLKLKKSSNQIDYNSRILLFGSCFTENIGNKLDYFKFQHFTNPFGIIFHPKAIEKLITNAINTKTYTEKDLVFHNERWHNFDIHSDLSDVSKENLLLNLNNVNHITNQQIKNSTHLIITLGTAWVYRFIETDTIVANCHKIPQNKFLKELLSADEISESLNGIVSLIKNINQNIEIIFTVSPVRHIKDGFVENSLSKAHLISAIHQTVSGSNGNYFPSYEIMMDDLRDYRFYKNDMIHPNKTAIDYIWEQFKNTWIHEDSFDLMLQIETIQKGLAHKPFNENSTQHQQFKSTLDIKIEKINKQYPQIKFK